MSGDRVKMSEIRSAGQCVPGQVKWIRENHPARYREWVREGILLTELTQLYPQLGNKIVRLRKAREQEA